ncbi:MAG: DUF2202 domain-containing protein, partial [Desulfuromonadales bacterium]|nr:DUF2202 domain-containing protein [Desulfuromonadales bacterium]
MRTNRSISKTVIMQLFVVAIVAVSFASTSVWAAKKNGSGTTALSEPEAEMLTFMREEEKLARDVYIEMFESWDAVIFSNIADSEQQHMDTLKKMIDKYDLPDPVLAGLGQFTNEDLQEKYNELVDAGSISYIDGLYVGATIEELDMVDIQHAIDVTSHIDIITAYQNLLEGSKSHLRAYVGVLEKQ